MRATIKNYLDAAKQRREENGQAGFSLIELIVVVAILGILVAIAIPVFSGIQKNAANGALEAAATSGLTVAAAHVAQGSTLDELNADLVAGNTADYTFTPLTTLPASPADVCVTAVKTANGALKDADASAGTVCTTD